MKDGRLNNNHKIIDATDTASLMNGRVGEISEVMNIASDGEKKKHS